MTGHSAIQPANNNKDVEEIMSYTSVSQRKEDFRMYLEKNGVVDSITKVLVSLYEEPERPTSPLEYIKKYLGASRTADGKNNAEETASLREENEKLKQRIKELEEQVNPAAGDEEKKQEPTEE